MFVERDDSGSDGGLPFGIGRPEQVDPAALPAWSRGRLPIAATTDADRSRLAASEILDVASAIEQLAVEVDAIERDHRAGRLESLELIDRYLTVWFAIRQIGGSIEAAESRE